MVLLILDDIFKSILWIFKKSFQVIRLHCWFLNCLQNHKTSLWLMQWPL